MEGGGGGTEAETDGRRSQWDGRGSGGQKTGKLRDGDENNRGELGNSNQG